MFKLLLTTCLAGAICTQEAPETRYDDMEQCLNQAAIIAGMRAGPTNLPYAYRADCGGYNELGIGVLSSNVNAGIDFPDDPGFPVGSDALVTDDPNGELSTVPLTN